MDEQNPSVSYSSDGETLSLSDDDKKWIIGLIREAVEDASVITIEERIMFKYLCVSCFLRDGTEFFTYLIGWEGCGIGIEGHGNLRMPPLPYKEWLIPLRCSRSRSIDEIRRVLRNERTE